MQTKKRSNVFYKGIFCGELIENDGNYTFKYDKSYIDNKYPAISHNFPLQAVEFQSVDKLLHPFFENLTSEGWLRQYQANALKTFEKKKFTILTHFGFDLAGAVYLETPEITMKAYPMALEFNLKGESLEKGVLSIESRASIPGFQKKVLVKKQMNGEFTMTTMKQLSTHIAKLSSERFPDVIELEFLSMLAVANLLPDDPISEIKIGILRELGEKALFVKRFDRDDNCERIHFEEFNSLLGKISDEKYNASYDDIGRFIRNCQKCRDPHQTCLTIYKRILASILIGNTDAHLKNMAMFHMPDGSLTLTPIYDVVCSSYYPNLNKVALKINNQKYHIARVKPKHLVNLGRNGFGLSDDEIKSVVLSLKDNLESAINALNCFQDDYIENEAKTRKSLVEIIRKRWNGSFDGIPKFLGLSPK